MRNIFSLKQESNLLKHDINNKTRRKQRETILPYKKGNGDIFNNRLRYFLKILFRNSGLMMNFEKTKKMDLYVFIAFEIKVKFEVFAFAVLKVIVVFIKTSGFHLRK